MVAITANKPIEPKKEYEMKNGVKMMLEAPNEQIPINPAEVEQEDLDLGPRNIVWRNVILLSILHMSLVYGFYSSFIQGRLKTFFWSIFIGMLSGLGVTAGAHRLWAHRGYKAKLPLRIFLCILHTMAGQNDVHEWSRDHRVHHKFSETNADPHNVKRGFWFAHMGWLVLRKHPNVLIKGKTVDCSDILADPVIAFEKKYYPILLVIFCYLIPTFVPVYFWGDSVINAYLMNLTRYCFTLHCTWLVNSAAHCFGNRPYDYSMSARENFLSIFWTMGEGFHNYHHVFPWDYAASELGTKWNLSTSFINLMAKWGQAYDLRSASPELIAKRMKRTGKYDEHYAVHDYDVLKTL